MRVLCSVLACLSVSASAYQIRAVPVLVRSRSCATPRLCASPGGDPAPPGNGARRTVRVVVPNSHLLAANTQALKKKKKGIHHVQIGSTRIDFAHDMKNSFLYGGIILGMAVVKIAKMGKSAFIDEPNYKHIARNDAEETELHEFCCEKCGYTMFPARGREGKFFPDDFKCPTCESPKESFFDMTDMSDPRTVKALEEDEDFDYEIEEIIVPIKDDDEDTGRSAPPQRRPPSPPPPPPPPAPAPKTAAPSPPPASPPPPPPPPPPAVGDDFDPLNNPLL
jgi:hypothetical protein